MTRSTALSSPGRTPLLLAALALLVCGLATPSQAMPVRVLTQYVSPTEPLAIVDAEASLDTGSLTGTGTEDVEVDVFELVFALRGFTQTASLIPGERGVLARFIDGEFAYFQTFLPPVGMTSLPIAPSFFATGERINVGDDGLLDVALFCCSALYVPVPGSHQVIPVPEPGTGLLLGGSLAALSLGRRRR